MNKRFCLFFLLAIFLCSCKNNTYKKSLHLLFPNKEDYKAIIMVEIYNKLILNKYTFLRFEVNNMNLWTKVYLVSNSDEIYLGADSYDILYKKICDGFFSENHNYKSFNFEDEEYICPLVLQEPYVCICRTKNKNNFKVLFLGDYYKIIRAKIIVNSKLLRFE